MPSFQIWHGRSEEALISPYLDEKGEEEIDIDM